MAKTVLLADDSATIRRVVELTFGDTEIHVDAVADGKRALERLSEANPDLVLADVEMPEPSGYELCRRIKASARPVPVLLLAGAFDPFDAERARMCGADGHLLKPFESDVLLERVRELLRTGTCTDPSLGTGTGPTGTCTKPGLEQEPRSTLPSPGLVHVPVGPVPVDALARAVAERLSVEVLREVAREVIPEVAERVVRERIRQLETETEDETQAD